MLLKGIIDDLRIAYDLKDRVSHEASLKRLVNCENIIPASGCARGDACICNRHAKSVCMYRLDKKP